MTDADRNASLVEKVARAYSDAAAYGSTENAWNAVIDVVLEEAAGMADLCRRQNGELSGKPQDDYHAGIRAGSEAIAAAIRALKEKCNVRTS